VAIKLVKPEDRAASDPVALLAAQADQKRAG
jgi:hypothetical protein